jgi:hypothetical protein
VLSRSFYFVSLIVVVGCSGKEEAKTEAKAPDCEATLAGAIDRMVGEAKKSMSGSALARIEAAAPNVRQAMHASCVADEWSPMALRCFGAAATQAEIDACTGKLTHEQYVRLHKKIDPMLAPEARSPVATGPEEPGAGPTLEPLPSESDKLDGESGKRGQGSQGSAAKTSDRRAPKSGQEGFRAPVGTGPVVPAAPPDCRKVVADPSSARCRQEFCKHNPTDVRCEVE